jgi:hypothetical protein
LLPYEGDDAVEATTEPAPAGFAGRSRWRTGSVLVAALAVPGTAVLVVAGVLLSQAGEPGARAPGNVQATTAAAAPARVRPHIYPTYGEFVPPASVTPRAAAPGTAPTARRRTSRPSPSPSRTCPSGWRDVPPLADWCKRNGYSID